MKKTSTLLFLVLSMHIASAQDTLTPAQMREDFNYMMEQYETGGLTTTFTRHNSIMLPNSGLTFYCSDKQFRHFGTTGSRGVLPDIPMEIGYKYLFRSFTAEELQQMIKMSNSKR